MSATVKTLIASCSRLQNWKAEKRQAELEYKKTLRDLRRLLPRNWRDTVVFNYPKYDSHAGVNKLNSVYAGSTYDAEVLGHIMECVENTVHADHPVIQ